jgi:hypothetical protein
MEETDMCIHPTLSPVAMQQQGAGNCAARHLGPGPRQNLAVQALARTQPITQLASDHQVSRKFVYQQAATAQQALDEAFSLDEAAADDVLFYLPVTKAWLRQLVLALILICHSAIRGVVELLRDLFNYPISVGTVHNIVDQVVTRARQHNDAQELSRVRIGAHDEIFQTGRPVLVGADVASTFCYLLSLEEHRDAETWGLRLLELRDRGFDPDATIADFGCGLRAGQELAMPGSRCRGDVFHAEQELEKVATFLENRAYQTIDARSKLERQQAEHRRRRGRANLKVSQKLRHACRSEAQAIALADEIATLVRWLREDIFAVNGLTYTDRCALYDFVVGEVHARAALCRHRLQPVYTLLHNHRDDLLAFAAQLDQDLTRLAQEFQVPGPLVRTLVDVQVLNDHDPRRWPQEAALRQALRGRFHGLNTAVEEIVRQTVRASSVIENLNSRLRNYFFLRRHLGPDYLALLQFFLNHRRFLRSEHPERVGKSPAELLTGQPHPHWLEMLGYQRFSRN